jgi:hypothetical protein
VLMACVCALPVAVTAAWMTSAYSSYQQQKRW